MKNAIKILAVLALALAGTPSPAVPTLQVGAYAGSGDSGIYADYQASSTSPTETDTAITGSTSILFAGIWSNDTVKLGSQYAGGLDYSGVDAALSVFDGHGAIVMVSVADGADASALTLGGSSAFYTSSVLDGLFPNNHDPLKDTISDFLFFDIGDFMNTEKVANFVDESGSFDGEIKALTIAGMGDLEWLHFDLMALNTTVKENKRTTTITTTWENNPGSKDVTWKKAPEPGILALLGIGLIALGLRRFMPEKPRSVNRRRCIAKPSPIFTSACFHQQNTRLFLTD